MKKLLILILIILLSVLSFFVIVKGVKVGNTLACRPGNPDFYGYHSKFQKNIFKILLLFLSGVRIYKQTRQIFAPAVQFASGFRVIRVLERSAY